MKKSELLARIAHLESKVASLEGAIRIMQSLIDAQRAAPVPPSWPAYPPSQPYWLRDTTGQPLDFGRLIVTCGGSVSSSEVRHDPTVPMTYTIPH